MTVNHFSHIESQKYFREFKVSAVGEFYITKQFPHTIAPEQKTNIKLSFIRSTEYPKDSREFKFCAVVDIYTTKQLPERIFRFPHIFATGL